MAIQSQFYRDLSKIEKKIWNVTWRQFKAFSLLLGVAIIVVSETLLLPDWALYVVALPTAFVLGYYPVYLLLGKWKKKKREFELHFMIENTYYYAGKIRRYAKHEFIPDKNSKETQKFN
uniref:PrgI family mobile element protein n=1 Tax=Lactococcus garvieae TaxID=1363 RepID=UPI00359CA186